ncbi:hypothetical protein [Lutimonas zeaxanthinifaciens]|uniref:hypothetical protein n=1 Tax=Lutimonas zeaxanthinifaciens TaxID=3060215 RepID=UPI00265D343D|nr:hypothetical protein [Lutimonas sp. YSD2104]WKK64721.1 hypothetical protein QZH61_08990 [Lutimonas sp. YSD2104]
MKNSILTFVILLISVGGFAQQTNKQSEKVTKYVTTFPNGEEAIIITDHSTSDNLKLSAADNFYKYEILETSNHELVHGSDNQGKVCNIDKNKFEDGTYTLKVYTEDFVITSDITISNGLQSEEHDSRIQ